MSRGRVLLAGIVGATLALAVPGSASADVPVSQVGWWTRSLTPPSVPEGGLAVGAAPDGASTVGAVLLDVGDGASGTELRLVETEGTSALAAIQVCPTTTTWSADDGGALEDAPEGRCDGTTAPMTRGDDGTWIADVQPLVEGKTGEVGLLVAPAAGSVAFEIAFAPPTVSGFVTEASTSASQPSTATTQAPATSSSAAPSPSPSGSPSFVAPVTQTPPTVATVTTLATLPDTSGVLVGSATAAQVEFTPQIGAAVPAGESSSDVGAGTVVLWYVIALIVGAAVAGIVWLRDTDDLSAGALLARVRRSS